MLKASRKLDMKGKSWVKTPVRLLAIFLEASGSTRSRVLLRGGPKARCRFRPLSSGSPLHGIECALRVWTLAWLSLSEYSPSDQVSAWGTEAVADLASGAWHLALDVDP